MPSEAPFFSGPCCKPNLMAVGDIRAFFLIQFGDALDMVDVVLIIPKEGDGIPSVGRVAVHVIHVEVEVEAEVVPQVVLEGLDVGFASVEPFFFTTPGAKSKVRSGVPDSFTTALNWRAISITLAVPEVSSTAPWP